MKTKRSRKKHKGEKYRATARTGPRVNAAHGRTFLIARTDLILTRDRSSPGLSPEEIAQDADLHELSMGVGESDVEDYFRRTIFSHPTVRSFLLQDPDHFLEFGKYVRNILDWGRDETRD
ncbi:hypothetical protein CDD83_8327 [Cordyceps sp. RAO-2017]|nr:hypothetical protein CDD83_8327 [Cordyceps sp. RAO-2017]